MQTNTLTGTVPDLQEFATRVWRCRMFFMDRYCDLPIYKRLTCMLEESFCQMESLHGCSDHPLVGNVVVAPITRTVYQAIISHGIYEVIFTMSLNEDSLAWAEEITDAYSDLCALLSGSIAAVDHKNEYAAV